MWCSSIHRIFTRSCVSILIVQRVAALCFDPDGTRLFADQPCLVNGTQDSFCCGPQATCLSDKLCWDGGGGYVRGSCTDATWKSSACPQFCLTPRDGAGQMTDCKDPTSDSWCCSADGKNGDPCDCASSNVTFPGARSLVSTIDFPGKASSTSSRAGSTRSSQSTSVAPSFTSPFSSTNSPSSNTRTQVSISGAASAAPASSTPTITSTPKSSNTNLGAAIGAPVVVVSVAFIILLLWFIRYRKRTNAKLKELQEQVTMREVWTEKPPLQQGNLQELSALERKPELGGDGSHELPVGFAA